MDIDGMIAKGKSEMDSALDRLKGELIKIRTGKASPAMLAGLKVEYYGAATPLEQVANITAVDSKTISIQAWEKNMLGEIEKAIFQANMGLTPMNDGENVRITIPPLTEERRRDLVKQCKGLGEEAKVSLRSSRQKMMDFVRKEVKDGYPEDEGKKREASIQEIVKGYGANVETMLEAKEKEVMTV